MGEERNGGLTTMNIRLSGSGDCGVLADLPPGRHVLGRDVNCDVCIDDEGVSRNHAEITWVEDRWHVTDLGSSNGTTVNGSAADGPVPLKDGDVVGLAGFALRVAYASASEQQPENEKAQAADTGADWTMAIAIGGGLLGGKLGGVIWGVVGGIAGAVVGGILTACNSPEPSGADGEQDCSNSEEAGPRASPPEGTRGTSKDAQSGTGIRWGILTLGLVVLVVSGFVLVAIVTNSPDTLPVGPGNPGEQTSPAPGPVHIDLTESTDADERLFLLYVLEDLYGEWPEDVEDPAEVTRAFSASRVRAKLFRQRIESAALGTELSGLYDDFLQLQEDYCGLMVELGLIKANALDQANQVITGSVTDAARTGITTGRVAQQFGVSSADAILAGLAVGGARLLVDAFTKGTVIEDETRQEALAAVNRFEERRIDLLVRMQGTADLLTDRHGCRPKQYS